MSTTPIRAALVGLGCISQAVHLPVLRRNHRLVAIEALVELSPARLARHAELNGVPAQNRFGDVGALVGAIEEGRVHIDIAILATSGSHVDDALALVGAGVRVLVEKPLALSHSELDRLETGLARLGADPDEWIRVGYMKEYDPATARARHLIDGVRPRHLRVEVLHPTDASQLRFARLDPPDEDVAPAVTAALAARTDEAVRDAIGGIASDDTMRRLYTNVILGSVIHDIALTRVLGLPIEEVLTAVHAGGSFPGSIVAQGMIRPSTTEDGPCGRAVPWHLGWHFIAGYPEYRERVVVHHDKGTIEIEFATPYLLNAPTTLRIRSAASPLGSATSQSVWPQEEAFERELYEMVALARGEGRAGSVLPASRADLAAAQRLWKACATSAGVIPDPDSEAAWS
ncbi:Gfo/Idh/MocA family protein [Actinomyces israelii]|uniref:Gfo/Idh/MocA family protein n=1 Tax=Actinomyces israelii TaxID=1659 RepID=UPI0005B8A2FA|nr:Gfo/Idh/MocA family oxidoreductase [Actinomyces israelii]